MSVEHGAGGHEEDTFTGIIVTILLSCILIAPFIKPVEEGVQAFVAPQASGGHGH